MNTRRAIEELTRFGWQVRVDRGDDLVPVEPGGALLCGDGRGSDSDLSYFFGPKLFGGVLGLAALMAMQNEEKVFDLSKLEEAIAYSHSNGVRPGIHDIHDDDVHCGQQVVAMARGVYPRQAFSPQAGRDYVLQRGGVEVFLKDEHAETELGVNLIDGTTRLPSALDQKFHVDFWFVNYLISVGTAVEAAIHTIEALKSPVRRAVVYSSEY